MTRRYDYQHHYRDLGPVPGSHFERADYAPRLRKVSRLLRALHVEANYPKSREMAAAIGASKSGVCALLNGRQLPSWSVVGALGRYLAQLSGNDPEVIERTLHDLYTTI